MHYRNGRGQCANERRAATGESMMKRSDDYQGLIAIQVAAQAAQKS